MDFSHLLLLKMEIIFKVWGGGGGDFDCENILISQLRSTTV